MRLSVKVAMWLIPIHLATLTAPGILIRGLAGLVIDPLWHPPFNDFDFGISGAIGLLWLLGMPVVMRGMDGWRIRWSTGLFSLATVVMLYAWSVIVVVLVLLLFQRPV